MRVSHARSSRDGGAWRKVLEYGRLKRQVPWPDDDIELSDEHKLWLWALDAIEHGVQAPFDTLRELASWSEQSDARCAMAALMLCHFSPHDWAADIPLMHEGRFQQLFISEPISDEERVRRFWSDEAMFSVAEQALLDELTSERRSTRLDLE
ncbi:MAG: hypothetical protein VX589_11445 [Myxococcota bacterium]|nr:hypothetical protein [Myxococcota bacterium]